MKHWFLCVLLVTVSIVHAGRVHLENSSVVPMSIAIDNPQNNNQWSRPFTVQPFAALVKPIGYPYAFTRFKVEYNDSNDQPKRYIVQQKKCMNGRTVVIDLSIFLEKNPILNEHSAQYFSIQQIS